MNVPKLRFKEFDGEWEEYSLADIAEFIKGKGISKDNLSAYGEPCILYGELYTKYKEVTSIIYSKTNIESRDLIKSKKFDVLIPSSGETAEDIACSTCVVQEDVLVGGDLNILRFEKDVDGRFISYQINGIKKRELSKYAQGATVVHLYSQGIKKLDLKIPTIEEQKKISELLLSLDKKIQLQQQKIDLLQEKKKGFLQKMFPKAGEKQPQVRFAGFTDDWELRKLGDIVDKAVDNRGKTPPVETEGKYPLLEVASLGNGTPDYSKVTKYVDQHTYDSWFRAHIQQGDILFSTVGNTGLVSLMDNFEGATIAQNIVAFRAKDGRNSEFLATMLQLHDNLKKAKRIEMGAVQPSIKVSQLIQVKYAITPNIEEQQKIGSFFKQLDDTIALHQRKLDLYKEQKKGFMQQMFI